VSITFVGAEDLHRALPIEVAVDVLERALREEQLPEAPQRTVLSASGSDLLLMPAVGGQGAGVKLVTINPRNPPRGLPLIHALYVLCAPDTLAPRAVIDGEALTALRTSAVSALATRHLAREDAGHLVLFGAGTQASAHLTAMRAVRPIERVTVVSRTRDRADALVARAGHLGLDARLGTAAAVSEADIICTCTTSSIPLFPGALVNPGAHINAVGSYRPDARELDDGCVRRARIVVETRTSALTEAGDLVIPLANGSIDPTWIVGDLQELVRGELADRDDGDLTLFKSVGVAFEDLIVAAAVYGRLGI